MTIEDIDFEISSLEWCIETMMHRLKQLEKERNEVVGEHFKKEIGDYTQLPEIRDVVNKAFANGQKIKKKQGSCLCSYTKAGFEINEICPQHGR
jgi:hypothetical protein